MAMSRYNQKHCFSGCQWVASLLPPFIGFKLCPCLVADFRLVPVTVSGHALLGGMRPTCKTIASTTGAVPYLSLLFAPVQVASFAQASKVCVVWVHMQNHMIAVSSLVRCLMPQSICQLS